MKKIYAQELADAVGGTLLSGNGDVEISSVSTNSKEIEKGALFVPIIGERVDAHRFINMALEAGATATFTSKDCEQHLAGKAYIKVEDTLVALQKAAAWYRGQFQVKMIGITGSVGKTTTKEMIAAAVETKYKTLKTRGNMNSQVGLPLMMFELDDSVEVAVIEMGMSEVGEMSRLAAIAKPDMVVMTNIGVSHIGQLGSKENIRKEKMNIIDEFTGGNYVFVNGDDPLLHEMKQYVADAKHGFMPKESVFDRATIDKLSLATVQEFGTSHDCEYRAGQSVVVGDSQRFLFTAKGVSEQIELGVLGAHNVNNAAVALAIAMNLGIEVTEAKKGLAAYRPISMRGQTYQCHGMKIIDDTYNASPDSMKSGVSVLLETADIQRRIAVFGDVMELGEVSRECHYDVGAFIAKTQNNGVWVDMVLTVGTEAKAICDGILDSGASIVTKAFETNQQVIDFLKEQAKAGDGILVKGSRGMHMEEVVAALKGE